MVLDIMFSKTEVNNSRIDPLGVPTRRLPNIVKNIIFNVWYQSDIEVFLKIKKFV